LRFDADTGEVVDQALFADDVFEGAACTVDDLIESAGEITDCGAGDCEDAVGDGVLGVVCGAITVGRRRDRAEFEAELIDDLIGDAVEVELAEHRCQIDMGVAEFAVVDVVEVESAVFSDGAGAGRGVIVGGSVPVGVERSSFTELEEAVAVLVADERDADSREFDSDGLEHFGIDRCAVLGGVRRRAAVRRQGVDRVGGEDVSIDELAVGLCIFVRVLFVGRAR
jgi:hypothetical protein